MGDLRSALIEKGWVSEEAGKKILEGIAEKEKSGVGIQIGRLKGKLAASLMDLEKVKTVSEFKEAAKKIILEDASTGTFNEIVRQAHEYQNLDGGKKLVWLILSLRDKLGKVKPEKREQVIKRALRSSNPTAEISVDWLL